MGRDWPVNAVIRDLKVQRPQPHLSGDRVSLNAPVPVLLG